MTVYELTSEQRTELKQMHINAALLNVSYSDLAQADNIIKDEEINEIYKCVCFSNDDFVCSSI